MKQTYLYVVGICSCLIFSIFLIRNLISREQDERIPLTKVRILSPEIDKGKLPLHSKMEGVFKLINLGENPYQISEVTTDCDCTLASWNTAPIPQGDTVDITVTYNNSHLPGFFRRVVEVQGNAKKNPIVLVFKGEMINP